MEFVSILVGKALEFTLKPVLDFTVKPVGRHLGYVLFYNSNIKELKKEDKKLKATENDVEGLVGAARRNNEVITKNVEHWMGSANEITQQAQRLFDKENDANTVCSHRSCPNLWLRYKLSKEANQLAAEADKLNGEGKSFDKVSIHQRLPDSIVPSSVLEEAFESRVSTVNEIMEALADCTVRMIGLHGLGGIGKTTLAREVAKKAVDEKLFVRSIFVQVKRNSIIEIQKQIAARVGLQFGKECDNELVRADQLRQRLEGENSLLIVLDDLWERLDFKQVGIPSADGGNTLHKFILTSRRGDLLSAQMNCKRNIMMGLLSEGEAWVLFKKTAEINDSDNSDLISKANEVCQKCARLPLAIDAVARALRNNKSLKDWGEALRRLKLKNRLQRTVTGIKEVDASLKLSYECLGNEELKSIFLLSAMFSQDPLIMDLFMYVVGLGLLEGMHGMGEARDGLDSLLGKLKASSLLLDSYSNDRFTIHDLVRDVALSIAFEEHHALVKRREKVDEWPNKYQLERCTAICLHECDIDELPGELYGPKVELFYLYSKDTELSTPSSFFNGMEELKVLSLSNMTLSSLPSSISLLNKLTTLSLRSCTLEDIALVEHLKELKILNLSNSTIEQLPCEVGQLSVLKILNLSNCYRLKVIPPKILSNLKELEELYMRNSFDRWEGEGLNEGKERASLDELKNLQNLSSLEIHILDACVLPKDLFLENSLERYKISIGRNDGFYYCEFSKTLTLEANNKINMGYGVFKLFEGVEELTLENWNITASLYESHYTSQAFSKLRKIKVSRCDQLKSLFSVSMVGLLSRLEGLKVSNCKSLEEIVASADEENIEGVASTNVVKFLQLRTLELDDLPALPTDFCFNNKVAFPNLVILIVTSINCKNIWDISTPESSGTRWSKLQKIEVSNCDQLKSLFPVFMVGILSKLERIKVCKCESLEEFVAFANHENVGEGSVMDIIEFSQLRSLKLEVLPALTDSCFDNKMAFPKLETLILRSINCKNMWDISTPESSETQSQVTVPASCRLPATEERKCDQLTPLFSVSMARILSRLKRIKVSKCKSLEEIPAFANHENVEKGSIMNVVEFHQLRTLELDNLPAFTDFCFPNKVTFPNLETLILTSIDCKNIWDICTPESSGTRWSKLQSIKVSNCDQLRSLFPVFMVGILSKLERIEVYKCESLEEIVAFANHENVEKGSVSDIIEFSQLRSLKLEDLPALTDTCFNNKMAFPKLESVELASVGWHNIWDVRTSIGTGTQITEIVESSQMGAVSFGNLKTLKVEKCNSLLKLIPSHILRSLSNLEGLEIRDCVLLEVIFDFGEFSDFKETRTFHLKTLYLEDLPELKTVCGKGFQEIVCFQSLQKLVIENCNNLEADEEVFLHVEELRLHSLHADMLRNRKFRAYHFSNVKFLSSGLYDGAATFPWSLLYRFPKLEQLEVWSCSFLVIFSSRERPLDNGARKVTSIKTLKLNSMKKLKYIWDGKCPLDYILQNLKVLRVSFCYRLINLGPSFVSLENLTQLDVSYCDEMINLLTSSTAKTLVQLTSLKITQCEKMEEIITNAEGDVENEIVFVKLKTLELNKLASCKSFCCHTHAFQFPSLEEVTIKECPKLMIFCAGILSTPLLKGVEVENYKTHWKSNLNETIHELFEEGSLFGNADVKIDEFPELIDVWMGKLATDSSFKGLTSLVMDKCDFLAYHAIPSYVLTSLINLKRLRVSNCDSVEVIFDLKGTDNEAQTSQAIPLRDLRVDHLPNLKYVWNKDPQTIICFQHLENMDARECESLRSIFPASIAKGLKNLMALSIVSCGVEVIVAEDHTQSSIIHFEFPKLRWLGLIKLPNLKNFYPQRHIVEWPDLGRMDVRQCEKLMVYGWEDPKIREKEAENQVENQYPLLSGMVVSNLTKLVLNQNHVKIIMNGKFQDDLFNRVSSLVLDSFDEDEPSDLSNTILKRFPQLTVLELSHNCSRFTNLAPCFASFDNLQGLTVSHCHHLGYLFTTLIARRLVNLQRLEIKDCKKMGEVVTNDGGDVEDTIVFKNLFSMKLIDLPILKSFCSQTCTFEFPSLKIVTMKGCSEMKMFCPGVLVTPLLWKVEVEENEKRWEGNLNDTLEQLFL